MGPAGTQTPRWIPFATLLFLSLLAVWRWFAAGAPSGGDGAQYLAHALALIEGRAYGDIGYLYTPEMWTVGPPTYPPGTSLLLAPVLALFGAYSIAPLVVMHLLLAAFLAFVWLYFAREQTAPMAWGVTALLAGSFLLGDRAHVVGSDLGFCASVWGVLYLADRDDPWTPGRTVAITAMGAAAVLFRLPAAPLIPALGVLLLLRFRRLGLSPVIPLVVWSVAVAFVVLVFGGAEGSGTAMTSAAAEGGGAGESLAAGLRWLAEGMGRKLAAYRLAISEALLYPVPLRSLNRAYHLVAMSICAVGLVVWLRHRGRSLAALFALFTALMLLVAPLWQSRYLWVLSPFICYGLLQGLVMIGRRGAARMGRPGAPRRAWLSPAVALVLVGSASASALRRPAPYLAPETDLWARVDRRLEGIDPDGTLRVASNRPRKVAWFTGVPAMPIVFRDLAVFLRAARERGVSHVVLTRAVREPSRVGEWDAWLARYPGLFVQVSEVGPIQIFRVAGYEVP